MQEEFIAETLLRLYLFAKAFYIGQGEKRSHTHWSCVPQGLLSCLKWSTVPLQSFFLGSEAKIPFFFFFPLFFEW